MSSRAHRWPAGATPLSRFHGGTAEAALRAIKGLAEPALAEVIVVSESPDERLRRRYAEWEARGKPPSPSAKPKAKARLRPLARQSSRPLILELIAAQKERCILCSNRLGNPDDYGASDPWKPSFDHVMPRSLGGKNEGNRLVAHRQCNSDKSNRRPTGCELVWLAAVNAITAQGIVTEGQDAQRLGERSE